MKNTAIGTFVFWALMATSTSYAQGELEVVENVDLYRYVGTWFEVAKIPRPFEPSFCRSAQAEYALDSNDENRITVVNTCLLGNRLPVRASGTATVIDPEDSPAKLELELRLFGRSFSGLYWILELDEDYEWAMVGSPDRENLFILSREPQLDDETLEYLQYVSVVKHGYPQDVLEFRE